jgi:hypothetical protein
MHHVGRLTNARPRTPLCAIITTNFHRSSQSTNHPTYIYERENKDTYYLHSERSLKSSSRLRVLHLSTRAQQWGIPTAPQHSGIPLRVQLCRKVSRGCVAHEEERTVFHVCRALVRKKFSDEAGERIRRTPTISSSLYPSHFNSLLGSSLM